MKFELNNNVNAIATVDGNHIIFLNGERVITFLLKGNKIMLPTTFSDAEQDAFFALTSAACIALGLKKPLTYLLCDVDYSIIKLSGFIETTFKVLPEEVCIKYMEETLKLDVSAFKVVHKKTSSTYLEFDIDKKAEELLAINKDLLKYMPMPEQYKGLAESLRKGLFNLCFILGPAGTGKTILAKQFASYAGAPLLATQASEGTTRDDIMGAADVKTDFFENSSFIHEVGIEEDVEEMHYASAVSSSSGGDYTIAIGPLVEAASKGWWCVLEEGNFLIPGVASMVNSMTDDSPTFEFHGHTIKKHPNFMLFITGNQDYVGTYPFNPATKSRGITLILDALSKEEFTERMGQFCDKVLKHKAPKKFLNKLYAFGNLVQGYADKFAEVSAVCIRHAQNLCRLIFDHPNTKEEFIFNIKLSYINNALRMDASNYDKSEALFSKDSEFMKVIEELYSLYNYKPTDAVDVLAGLKPLSFADIVNSAKEGWLTDNPTSASEEEDLDDAMAVSSDIKDLFAD